MEEPARRVIAGLTLTDADCEAAVEILESRFAKPALIKRVHINQLMNLAPVFNERNVGRLRYLLGDIETHLRGLEALKVDKESYSSIVAPVFMDKIPEQIRMNMIRFGWDYLSWTLDEMLDAIVKRDRSQGKSLLSLQDSAAERMDGRKSYQTGAVGPEGKKGNSKCSFHAVPTFGSQQVSLLLSGPRS